MSKNKKPRNKNEIRVYIDNEADNIVKAFSAMTGLNQSQAVNNIIKDAPKSNQDLLMQIELRKKAKEKYDKD